MSCRHPDIRKFDGIRCCLACGEAVFESTTTAQPRASSNSEYQYQRLNYTLGQEIRLIELLSAGEYLDNIRCRMHHVNLEDDPAYEAVSYTWATEDGDVQKCRKVEFTDDNGYTMVTRNCEAALRQLRKRGCSRHLWVDAICIDQTYVSERNHQVGLMDKIFSKAWRVLMCMQDDRSGAAEQYATLFQCIQAREHLDDATVLILDRLINARYFKRVWVIQEVALARSAYLRVNDHKLLLSPSTLATLAGLCSEHHMPVPSVLRWVPGQKSEYELTTCLAAGTECQATDPKDKVFALLSIMEPAARSLIPVDYSMHLRLVHAYTMIAIMSTQNSLDLLRYIHVQRPDEARFDLPLGYVSETLFRNKPQFTSGKSGTWQPSVRSGINDGSAAPGNADLEVRFDTPDEELFKNMLPRFAARAHYLDTVAISRFCSHPGHRGPVRCSCSYKDLTRRSVGASECERSQHVWLSNYVPGYNIMSQAIPTLLMGDLKQRLNEQGSSGRPSSYAYGFVTRFSVGCAGVDFEEGDEIFAIDGASVPFILRPTGHNKYRLVGECYLWAALDSKRSGLGLLRRGRKRKRLGHGEHFAEPADQTRTIEICTPIEHGVEIP